MLLAIDVGNTETVIGLYDLGGDDAAVPPPTSASASPSRTSRPAGSPTAGDSRRSQPNPDELAVLFTQLLDLEGLDIATSVSAWPCPPRCLGHRRAAPDGGTVVRHQALRGARPGVRQRHADPLRQPERGRRRPRGQTRWRLRALRRPVHRRRPRHRTTFDAISSVGEYLAGHHPRGWPSAWRRSSSTRRPPPCRAGRPARVIGRSTVESIQSGTLYGFGAQVDGLCSRFMEVLAPPRSSPPAAWHPSSHRSPARSSTWNPG